MNKKMTMNIKFLRQILKTLGDDTRLRILYLLSQKEISVKDICKKLHVSQPTISKHLMRLRMMRMVTDRRCGNQVNYRIEYDSEQGQLIHLVIQEGRRLGVFSKKTEAEKGHKVSAGRR